MATPANPATAYKRFLQSQAVDYGGIKQLGTTGTWATPAASEPLNNLPFDSRMRRISVGGSKKSGAEGAFTPGVVVTSGKMIAQPVSVGSGKSVAFECYFQFNPTEIDVAYEFDSTVTGALNPAYITTAGSGSQGLALNQTISFSLLFDRTFEVWTGMNAGGGIGGQPVNIATGTKTGSTYLSSQGPYIYGAQWDVWAIERLLGIYGQASGKGPNGPPAASVCNVQFAQDVAVNSAGQGAGPTQVRGSGSESATPAGRAINFNGWMTSMQVEYTRFDASMVPTRAAVALSFELVYSVEAVYTNPGQGNDFQPSKVQTTTPEQRKAASTTRRIHTTQTGNPTTRANSSTLKSIPAGTSGFAN